MLHDQGTLFILSTFRFMIVNLVIYNTIEQHVHKCIVQSADRLRQHHLRKIYTGT
jgi:hypothetical protein